MAFVVIYDACVLYPAPLRDLLIRIARTGLVRARWTNAILDECFRSILADRPDLQASDLKRTRELMVQAVPGCLVEGSESLIDGLALPDPDDRHVLATAIAAGAQVIVTWNVKDFPAGALAAHGIEAQDPDEFINHLLGLSTPLIYKAVVEQAADLKNPPMTLAQVLDKLEQNGLAISVAQLRALES